MHYYNFQGKIPMVCLRERILLGGVSHISHPPKYWKLHKSNQNIKLLLQTVWDVCWYTLRQEASKSFGNVEVLCALEAPLVKMQEKVHLA